MQRVPVYVAVHGDCLDSKLPGGAYDAARNFSSEKLHHIHAPNSVDLPIGDEDLVEVRPTGGFCK